MGRRHDSTDGAPLRADAAAAITHDREVTSTTGRAQGHAPARPPFRIGDTVRHDGYGTGTVNGTCQWDARWNGWWVPVQFATHTTRVLGKLLWAE